MASPSGDPTPQKQLRPAEQTLVTAALDVAKQIRTQLQSDRRTFEDSKINDLTLKPDGTVEITEPQKALIRSFVPNARLLGELEESLQKLFEHLGRLPRTNAQEFKHASSTQRDTLRLVQEQLATILGSDDQGDLLSASYLYQTMCGKLLGGLGNPRLIRALMSSEPQIPVEAIQQGFKPTCYGLALNALVLGSEMRQSLNARYSMFGDILVEEIKRSPKRLHVVRHYSGGPMVAEVKALERLKEDPNFNPRNIRLELTDFDPNAQGVVLAELERLFPDPEVRPFLSYTNENPFTPLHQMIKGDLTESAPVTEANIRDGSFRNLSSSSLYMIGFPDYLKGRRFELTAGQVIESVDQRYYYIRWGMHYSEPSALIAFTNYGKTTPRHKMLWCVCKWPLDLVDSEGMAYLGHANLLTHRLDKSLLGVVPPNHKSFVDLLPGQFGLTTDPTNTNLAFFMRNFGPGAPRSVTLAKHAINRQALAVCHKDDTALADFQSQYRFFAATDWKSIPAAALSRQSLGEEDRVTARQLITKIGDEQVIITITLPWIKREINSQRLVELVKQELSLEQVAPVDFERFQTWTGIAAEEAPPFGLAPTRGRESFRNYVMLDSDLIGRPLVWNALSEGHRLVWSPRHFLTHTNEPDAILEVI